MELYKFKLSKRRFGVLDVNSSALFEINEIGNDVLSTYDEAGWKQDSKALSPKYGKERVRAVIRTLDELKRKGFFGATNKPIPAFSEQVNLCGITLHISNACNLRCRYCYENVTKDANKNNSMSFETAQRAVDFLIRNSGREKTLTVSFFGGEPLLEFQLIQRVVRYIKKQEKKYEKNIKLSLLTNGTLLRSGVIDYLNASKIKIVISLDGPKDFHDSMRCFSKGEGSYDAIISNIRPLLEMPDREIAVRASLTHYNLSISKIIEHLATLKFKIISVFPVVTRDNDCAINGEDIKAIKAEYKKIFQNFLKQMTSGSIAQYAISFSELLKSPKNIYMCGAGKNFLAVSSNGSLYPCQRFTGMKKYRMGNVVNDTADNNIQKIFRNAHIGNKKECSSCWARYFCGGGCPYEAVLFNNDINLPRSQSCDLIKYLIEISIRTYLLMPKRKRLILTSIARNVPLVHLLRWQ